MKVVVIVNNMPFVLITAEIVKVDSITVRCLPEFNNA